MRRHWGTLRRTPLRRATLLATAFGLLVSTLAIGPALAADSETFEDRFKKIGYNGNDGSLLWTAKWAETPVADGAKRGVVQVVNANRCAGNNCLRIGGNGEFIGFQGILREADLTGANSATLTFSYRRKLNGDPGGGIVAMATVNGFQWDPLDTFDFDGSDGNDVEVSYDVTDWIDNDTRIGFFGFDTVDGFIFIDDVKIEAFYGNPPVLETNLQDRTDTEADTVSFFADASDPDGGAVFYSATNLPPGISIDRDSGEIWGTIDFDGANGSPYATKVTATDESGDEVVDTFTWTVLDLNRDPVLEVPAVTVANELEQMSLQLSATDPDLEYGDRLTFSLSGAPNGASVNPDSGVITWTPTEADGPGSFEMTAKVTDQAGDSDTVTVPVTVLEVNDPPSISSPGDQANGVGDVIALQLAAGDPDLPANNLVFEGSGLPPGLSLNSSTGAITGKIAQSAAADSPFTVTVRVIDDGSPSLLDETVFGWVITNDNRAPVLAPIPPQTLPANGTVSFLATATDPDGDNLTFSLVDGTDPVPNGASITSGGQFTWAPTDSQRGEVYRFKVKVTDDGVPNLFDKQEIEIDLPDINRSPSLENPGTQTTPEGASVDLVLNASDPNLPGDALTFTATGLPPGLSMATNGLISGTVAFTAAAGSPYTVTATVTDAGSPALSDDVTFTWNIENVNRPPVVSDASYSVLTGDSVVVVIDASDPDDDELSYSVDPPQHGTFSGSAPSWTYRPTVSTRAVEGLEVTVSDGEAEATATLTIEIRSSNLPPVAVNDQYEVDQDDELVVGAPGLLGNDRDADGDTLAARLATAPASGTVVVNRDGSFGYRPDPGFVGSDSFTYEVTDGLGRSTARVAITVNEEGPEVVDDPRDDIPLDDEPVYDDVVDAIVVVSDTPPPMDDPPAAESTPEAISRTFVTIGRAGIQQIPTMGFPLLLLIGTFLLALTFGRISTLPLFGGSREQFGWVKVYDPTDGFGLIRRTSGADVFVESSALRTTLGRLRPGQRVRFRVIEGGDRSIATKVWVD